MGLKEIARCDKIRVAERGGSEGGLVRSPSDSQGNGLPPNKIAQKCVRKNGCTSRKSPLDAPPLAVGRKAASGVAGSVV